MDDQTKDNSPLNQNVNKSGPKWVKFMAVDVLLLVIVIGAVWFIWKETRPQVSPKASNNTIQHKNVVVADAISYKDLNKKILPSQFPKDFPNPSKENDVLNSSSMISESVFSTSITSSNLVSNNSVFKFVTSDSKENIIKIYRDYFSSNSWTIVERNLDGYYLLSGEKGSDIIDVSIKNEQNNSELTVNLLISTSLSTSSPINK
jgi:hypothetical protein